MLSAEQIRYLNLMSLPTASQLHRAMLCPPAYLIARWEGPDRAQAARGTSLHEYVAHLLAHGSNAALLLLQALPADLKDRFAAVDLKVLTRGGKKLYAAEHAFALNLLTKDVASLGVLKGARRYESPFGPDVPTIFGTADFMFCDGDQGLGLAPNIDLVEMKTGSGHLLPPIEDNPQLLFAAYAIHKTLKPGPVDAMLFMLPQSGDKPTTEICRYSIAQMETFADRLQEFGKRFADTEAAYRAQRDLPFQRGKHCTYCPAFYACPAQYPLLQKAMALSPRDLPVSQAVDIMTPEEVGRLKAKVEDLLNQLKPVQAAIYAYAQETPIVMPDGSTLKGVSVSKDKIDAYPAYQLLTELYGEDVAKQAVEYSFSKTGLKAALANASGPHIDPKHSADQRLNAALKLLKAKKILTTSSHSQMRHTAAPGTQKNKFQDPLD